MSLPILYSFYFTFFFFHDPAATEIYTLSLHDALPISSWRNGTESSRTWRRRPRKRRGGAHAGLLDQSVSAAGRHVYGYERAQRVQQNLQAEELDHGSHPFVDG